MDAIEQHLLKELHTFTAFARRRVGDPHLADDVVQESLLKAVKAADRLGEDDNITAWFYRILRRTIIDLYRRRDAAGRAHDRLTTELDAPPDADEQRTACACVETLLPALNPDYAALIRRLDLEEQPPESVAAQLGVTANNLRVRHHRARQQLRERLEQTCQMCATHGCLDCTCDEAAK